MSLDLFIHTPIIYLEDRELLLFSQQRCVHPYQLIIFTFAAHPTVFPLNKVRESPLKSGYFLVFHYLRVHALYEAPPPKGSSHYIFCLASTHTVKPKPDSDTTCWETYKPIPLLLRYDIIHIGFVSDSPKGLQ